MAAIEMVYLIYDFIAPKRKKQKKTDEDIINIGNKNNYRFGSVTPYRKNSFFLVRKKNGDFIALSVKCTHMGCALTWNEKEGVFECPCHASRFSITGEVLQPPATREMDAYAVKIEKEEVLVDISHLIKRTGPLTAKSSRR